MTTSVTYNSPGPDIKQVRTYGSYLFRYCMDTRVGNVISHVMYYCQTCGVPLFWFPIPNGEVQLITHANWHYDRSQT